MLQTQLHVAYSVVFERYLQAYQLSRKGRHSHTGLEVGKSLVKTDAGVSSLHVRNADGGSVTARDRTLGRA